MAYSPRAPAYVEVGKPRKKNFFTALSDLRKKRKAKRTPPKPVLDAPSIPMVPQPADPPPHVKQFQMFPESTLPPEMQRMTMHQRLARDVANGTISVDEARKVLDAIDGGNRRDREW